MITVSEARLKIQELFDIQKTAEKDLLEAVGYVLAETIVSPVEVPPFDNSAMDGYAFSIKYWDGVSPFKIVGESAAGDNVETVLKQGEAMRIFTGAMVPKGADTVALQERVLVENGLLYIEDGLDKGANIRLKGSQTKRGQIVLSQGYELSPGAIGLLAGMGIRSVLVYEKPVVNIVVTGKEIVPPGSKLHPGQVYECNSYSLSAALQQLGIVAKIYSCTDEQDSIHKLIQKLLNQCDMLIITGGISMGDYDFVLPVLRDLGVKELFYKVRQKPAKPFFAGLRKKVPIFGLPGNPASVLTTYYVYLYPLLRAMLGFKNPWQFSTSELDGDVSKKSGLTLFAKGHVTNGHVKILQGQESYRMDAFTTANCFVEIGSDTEFLEAGSKVTVIPF